MTKQITTEHIDHAYETGVAVYAGRLARSDGVNVLVEHGMSRGSAGDYVQVIRCILDGRRYTRAISAAATEAFLKNIARDFGAAKLQRAVAAVFAHVDYYDSLGAGRLVQIRQIAEHYARLL